MEMRATWTCPDLPGDARGAGRKLPVPGSQHSFPECPAAYLRDSGTVALLQVRRGGRPFALHLVDGFEHLGPIVSQYAMEIRAGARTLDSLPSRIQQLVSLHESETVGRDAYEDELRDQERKTNAARK